VQELIYLVKNEVRSLSKKEIVFCGGAMDVGRKKS
jgi:hypothetical protein